MTRRRPRRALGGALAALLACGLLAGCSSDPKESYCKEVSADQGELGTVLGAGGDDALLKALPLFEQLHDKAPEDIRDDWQQLTSAIEALRDALDDAEVDASTYDRAAPPAGVTQQQRGAIDAAARGLTDPVTVAAFEAVQQQARDVCGTPLSI